MPNLNRAARDEAWSTIHTLLRCYKALSAEHAPAAERRRYLDRVQETATRAGITLTPAIRAALLETAERENATRGTLDLHR